MASWQESALTGIISLHTIGVIVCCHSGRGQCDGTLPLGERTCFKGFQEDGLGGHARHGQRRRDRGPHRRKVVVEAAQVHCLHPQVSLQQNLPSSNPIHQLKEKAQAKFPKQELANAGESHVQHILPLLLSPSTWQGGYTW